MCLINRYVKRPNTILIILKLLKGTENIKKIPMFLFTIHNTSKQTLTLKNCIPI